MKPLKMILISEGRENKEVDLTGKTYMVNLHRVGVCMWGVGTDDK